MTINLTNTLKNIIVCFTISFAGFFISCRNQEETLVSPSEKTKESLQNLRKELIEAPLGWKVTYFPQTDSLLFSNKDEVLEKDPAFSQNFGFGGHYFIMNFQENGEVKMLWDQDKNTIKNSRKSEFEVRQNTYTQLSFTTPNYLHHLVNERYEGSSDFLYYGKDFDGNLIFKTASYTEPAREFIRFEKIKKEENANEIIEKSFTNRTFFESMNNPHITIKKGSKIYYKSDMPTKSYFLDSEINRAKRMEYQRYYYFRFNKRPNLSNGGAIESNALGSGYVGTEKGISFRTGIRYTESYVFYDFERVGDTFICELVRVYDPIRKKYRIMSKHLAPKDAETTGYIAEIKL